jgi:hypothetical protein
MNLAQMQAAVKQQQKQAKEQEQLVKEMANKQAGVAAAHRPRSPAARNSTIAEAKEQTGARARSPSSPPSPLRVRSPSPSRSLSSPQPPLSPSSPSATTSPSSKHPRSHPLDHSESPDLDVHFAGDTAHMRELVFGRARALAQQHERSLQINPTKHRIGAVLMTDQQRDGQSFSRAHTNR